jgi:DNA (cytosine-5)-methyltransferase 1
MTHIDLFSGIGGFALAARWAGIETIQFVEIDPFCQKVLNKNFPGIPIHDDIKTYSYANGNGLQEPGAKLKTGRIRQFHEKNKSWTNPFILTGGFPCQPFSCAGKRRGKEDDRFLWPEMLRVISEPKPTWVIGENVAGFINMGLDDCILDLERECYEVQPLIIPACAVNAPHRRDRVWIVGHSNERRTSAISAASRSRRSTCESDSHTSYATGSGVESVRRERENAIFQNTSAADPSQRQDDRRDGRIVDEAERSGECGNAAIGIGDQDVADTASLRCEIIGQMDAGERMGQKSTNTHHASSNQWSEPWFEVAARLCRVDARVSNRVDRLKSLGNAVVPRIPYLIMKAILEVEKK